MILLQIPQSVKGTLLTRRSIIKGMNIKPTFLIFPLLVVTGVFFTIFAVAQQIQIAGDMVYLLDIGTPIETIQNQINALRKVDVSLSLSPFVAVYDAQGKLLASSGIVDNQPISIPSGVFTGVSKTGESRVTLEPQAGVRIASDIQAFNQSKLFSKGDGFVVSGKSLSETEKRIHRIALMVLLAWIAALVIFGFAAFSISRRSSLQPTR